MLELNLTLLVQMALFLVFAGLMNAVFFKPVTKVLAERKAFIKQQHDRATRDLAQIQALEADYEARLKSARQEAQSAIQAAVAEAESKRNALLGQVKSEVASQIAQARDSIRKEKEIALAELGGDVSQLASLIARKVGAEPAALSARGGNEA